MTRKSHGLANRPGEPYPATFRLLVDPPGIEPGLPVCRTGVVPLDHEPVSFCVHASNERNVRPLALRDRVSVVSPPFIEFAAFDSGPDGNRTHRTDLARISRLPWYMPARSIRLLLSPSAFILPHRSAASVEGPSGNRTRSPSSPRTCAAGTPTDRCVSDPGWN
jgi:hypothetical protein